MAMAQLLLIDCVITSHFLWEFLCLSCYALLSSQFSFAIILKRRTKLGALLLLSDICIVTINVLWLFLTVLLVSV